MTSSETLATADIVVVGAGISGVCTAFELNRRGFDVVLCDQRFPAFGASGRNSGSVWVQFRRPGVELQVAREAQRKYREYIEVLGDTFDYQVNGGLLFYEAEEQQPILAEYVTSQRAAGVDLDFISLQEARKHAPMLPATALGAVFCAEDAQVDSQAFVHGLAAACVRAGVRNFENTAVLSTLRNGDAVTGVRTVRGDIHAPGVVWATGAWARNLRAEGIAAPIKTARGGLIVTQPIEQQVNAIMHGPRGVAACGALSGLGSYRAEIFPVPARNALSNGGSDGWDYDDSLAVNRAGSLYIGSSIDSPGSLNPHIGIAATNAMISTTVHRYKQYADCGVTGLWAGLVSDTADHLPIVDRVDGAYINAGHSWGMASGPVCGEVMAQVIAGEPAAFARHLSINRAGLDSVPPDN